jgi:pimeloyl-ACP methyl ester carboxylesterase
MIGHCILSHGLDSSPEATKAVACANVARALGWTEQRPDYRAFDADQRTSVRGDVEGRIAHLKAIALAAPRPLVLAGSSMGAFVSARVALEVPVAGLFLMAPPVWLEDFDIALRTPPVPIRIVHGWRDEIIAAVSVAAWAQVRNVRTTFVDDSHRLEGHVDFCGEEFGRFLLSLP